MDRRQQRGETCDSHGAVVVVTVQKWWATDEGVGGSKMKYIDRQAVPDPKLVDFVRIPNHRPYLLV